MLADVKGYYDGKQIIVDESDRHNLSIGDELIITILDKIAKKQESRVEKRMQIIDSEAFVTPAGRTADEIDSYMKELRADDGITCLSISAAKHQIGK